MKVAQILYSGLGGHGSVVFSLMNADKNKEWDSVLGFLGIEPLAESYRERCISRDIGYEYIPAVERKPWKSWRSIVTWLNKEKPNVILLHSTSALLPCWYYAKTTNTSLIAIEHTPNIVKRKSEWVVSGLVMMLADKVVLLTSEYRNELKHKLKWMYRDEKVRIVPNGIDTDYFVPVEKSFLEKGKTIHFGMAARFTEKKRQDILIDMLPILIGKNYLHDFRLSLAGDGETLEVLKKRVKELGLEKYVDFPGYLDEEALREWFGTLDVYLHASEGETLSTSLLQAMSMGLPIIASNVVGIENLLQNRYGLLVKGNSAKDFANSIERLMMDREMVLELSTAARKLAIDKYSQYAMYKLYNKLIREKRQ